MKNLLLRNLTSAALTSFWFLSCTVCPPTVAIQNKISTSRNELESLFDPVVAEQMTKLHIPGAAIAVVKDGKILFTKGYGYADIEKKTPVVSDKTIFRIGSITKVFTAIAVMQ